MKKIDSIRQNAKREALEASQGRVIAKKDAVVNTGVQTGEVTEMTIDNKADVTMQAALMALEGKKVKVKSKR